MAPVIMGAIDLEGFTATKNFPNKEDGLAPMSRILIYKKTSSISLL